MSTTPLLGITELTPNQSGKETTVNDAIIALEAATNATLAVAMAAGDVTLSANQFTRNIIFNCTGATANRILNIPAQVNGVNVSRIFGVRNSTAFQITVQVTGAPGTAVVLQPSETRLCDVDGSGNVHVAASPPSAFAVWSDATANHNLTVADANAYLRMTSAAANTVTIPLNSTTPIPVGTRIWIEQAGAGKTTVVGAVGVTLRQSSTQAQLYLRAQFSQVWATKVGTDEWVLGGDFGGLLPYAVGGFAPSSIQSNEVLMDHPVIRAFTFPANFAGSQASAGTNPGASFVMTVQKISGGATTNIGTITIGTGGAVAFATTGGLPITLAAGDVLCVLAPSTPDGTIARLRFTLVGSN